MPVEIVAGRQCLVVEAADASIRTARDFMDRVGDALSEGASLMLIPVSGIDPAFFDLRNGLLGEALQKAANYRLTVAVVGDISAHTSASRAFHDLVVESQRATGYMFVSDRDALEQRLACSPAR